MRATVPLVLAAFCGLAASAGATQSPAYGLAPTKACLLPHLRGGLLLPATAATSISGAAGNAAWLVLSLTGTKPSAA